MTAAVLLTCHGTVSRLEDVPAFLANIRRGRPTPPEIVQEVQRRLSDIGGSPLMRITAEQAEQLEARLAVPVRIAARAWHPYPREVLPELASAGATTIVSLPLAPEYVDAYHAAVREAAAPLPSVEVRCVPCWSLEPALIDACAEAVTESLEAFPEGTRSRVAIVLSAHSLPKRVVDAGDPYERDFRARAELVGARFASRGHPIRIAFQSQGMTGDVWLGPDLETTMKELVREGHREVLVAPIGFVADHVETLYDLDIEARRLAVETGIIRFERVPALNTRPRFIDALEAVARRALQTEPLKADR